MLLMLVFGWRQGRGRAAVARKKGEAKKGQERSPTTECVALGEPFVQPPLIEKIALKLSKHFPHTTSTLRSFSSFVSALFLVFSGKLESVAGQLSLA